MSKKIIYFVQGYEPKVEAISKEVAILARNFDSKIFDLATKFKFVSNKKITSIYYRLYPLAFILMKLNDKKNKISHIYASLGDFPYLTFLKKKPIVITGISLPPKERIKKSIKKLKRLNKIVVECNRDKRKLIEWGIHIKKIEVVYPGIDLKKFSFAKAKGNFNILFASSPMREIDFEKKGVNLVLRAAKEMAEIGFIMLWRNVLLEKIKNKIKKDNLKNVLLVNKYIENMNDAFAQAHATIMPYMQENDKSCPLSLIESLAAGKPVIVSDKVGVSDIIKKEKCGVVFKNEKDIVSAVKELKKNYRDYQKNCRKTALKYFSIERFIKDYQVIYHELS